MIDFVAGVAFGAVVCAVLFAVIDLVEYHRSPGWEVDDE